MSDTPLSTHTPSPTDHLLPDTPLSMANSDISVPSVDHRQESSLSIHSRYTALQPFRYHIFAPFSLQSWVTRWSSLQDRPPYHKIRCSISHNGP
ncbi:hypothetical protein BASA83_009360 [Batrachochytrium salamandrivorans]|nr:hypothetical protein BASA83_009360 [Batrachochytrium salamandrivorans]